MPVSIVGRFLYAGWLPSCSAQLRDHPEGLKSDLKASWGPKPACPETGQGLFFTA